jgi:hypothetical protein
MHNLIFKNMNKKIVSEIVIGLILFSTVAVGAVFFLNGKNTKQVNSQPIENEQKKVTAKADGKINTKFGYDKSLELIKDEQGMGLVNIAVMKSSFSDYNQYRDKIIYSFYSDIKAIATAYDYVTGEVTILEKKDVKENPFNGIIPDDIIKFGYEGANDLLLKNTDYISYKGKFPELFKNETVGVVKDDKYGWEWRFAFISKEQKMQMVVFSVNSNSGNVVLIKKNNVD